MPAKQCNAYPGSTDCIFNGDLGEPYPADYLADATDDYGWSKRLGEVVLFGRPNTLVLRVSIIGPDRNPEGKGLMNPGEIPEARNIHQRVYKSFLEWHYYARMVQAGGQLPRENRMFDFKLEQYGTREFYSKYEMLILFNEIYNLGLQIEPKATDIRVDRRLLPDIECKNLKHQLQELKAFENV